MIHWWEIPLALFSFVFNKVVKFFVGILYTVYLAFNRKRASQWQVLSEETLAKPLSLPVLMTKAPRWNTHAIIGTLGPFSVQKSVALELEATNQSAQSWIAILYSFPGYRTVASIESKDYTHQSGWASLDLKPGRYTIGLRYYNWCQSVKLPAIKVDGNVVVDSINVDSHVNQFYNSLMDQKNWFYRWLHTYIYILLKGQWLPTAFVAREFLPVGATDTAFFYGYLHEENFQVDVTSQLLNQYDIYLTVYNRSSLPVSWCQIEEEHTTQALLNHGFYLFRLRQKPRVQASAPPLKQQVSRHGKQVKITIAPEQQAIPAKLE